MAHRTAAAVLAAALLTSPAFGSGGDARAAGLANGTLTVNATVPAQCNVSGDSSGSFVAASLDFGTHPPVGESLFANSTNLYVRCNFLTASLTISLDAGTNPVAPTGPRQMAGPSSTFAPYTLFHDSALTQPWTPNVFYPVAVTTTSAIQVPVYGATVASSNLLDGLYSDTVHVTISY